MIIEGSGKEDAADLLSPAMFLTKICIVSSASAEVARDEELELEVMLLERMMAAQRL